MVNFCWNGVNILANHRCGTSVSNVSQLEPMIRGEKMLHIYIDVNVAMYFILQIYSYQANFER